MRVCPVQGCLSLGFRVVGFRVVGFRVVGFRVGFRVLCVPSSDA